MNILDIEYNRAFPPDLEYRAWILALENDELNRIKVDLKRAKFSYTTEEELSPFATVNS